jgi:hypothetical protein
MRGHSHTGESEGSLAQIKRYMISRIISGRKHVPSSGRKATLSHSMPRCGPLNASSCHCCAMLDFPWFNTKLINPWPLIQRMLHLDIATPSLLRISQTYCSTRNPCRHQPSDGERSTFKPDRNVAALLPILA